MSQDIYEKNVMMLRKKDKELAEKIEEASKEEWLEVGIEEAMDGGIVPYIIKDERQWILCSRYEPKLHAEISASKKEYKVGTVLFVFGFSGGEYIRQLIKRYGNSIFYVIYEPNLMLMKKIFGKMDCSDILERKEVVIFAGNEKEQVMENKMLQIVNNENYKMLFFEEMLNYRKLYPEKIEEYEKWIVETGEQIPILNNTVELFYDSHIDNSYYTSCDILFESSVVQIKKKLESIDKSKVPGILVSAGPSLDKNIEELKKAEGKAFILVVDTALKSVYKAGIHPDLTITVDPNKPLVLFEQEQIIDIPMVVLPVSRKEVIRSHMGKRFYSQGESFIMNKLEMQKGIEYPVLETGGSVANSALALLLYLGFQTIIFVGQDLAFTDGKGHVKGAYEDEVANKEYVDKNKFLLYVEDNEGGMIKTEAVFDRYRKWFEKKIEEYNNVKFINATEGGAKMNGAEYIPLKMAVERECIAEVDFKKMIQEIPPYLDVQKVEEMKKYILEEVPGELEELEEYYSKKRKSFERDIKKIQNSEYTKENVKWIIDELGNFTDEKKSYDIMGMFDLYVERDASAVSRTIYSEEADDVQEEIQMLCEKGLKLIEIYDEGMKQLKKDYSRIFEYLEECEDKHRRR